MNRRYFLGASVAGVASLSLRSLADEKPSSAMNHLVVAIIGTGGRGTGLAGAFAQQKDVTVAYVCDVDKKHVANGAAAVDKITHKPPQMVEDFRTILDDKQVNAVVVATCNHWHAPAAIMACAHGKHVYVEKPCSYTAQEGEWLVDTARKNNCKVQMGNQRRSWPMIVEAIEKLHAGAIGRLHLAQSWYTARRGSIGRGEAKPVPAGLNYDLWQGPAPRREFRSNFLHYNWHWFWHWGNGELGNNGVHMIDLCRWGLGVDYPIRVTSTGGRYAFDDDQETPDTHVVSFDFPDRKSITWDGLSCDSKPERKLPDVVFHGDKGKLIIQGTGYSMHDNDGKEIGKASAPSPDSLHIGNFLDAIRHDKPLNSEILGGHQSTLLCHLGNISHRTGRALKCEPKLGHIVGDAEAAKLWTREYAKGFEPVVSK